MNPNKMPTTPASVASRTRVAIIFVVAATTEEKAMILTFNVGIINELKNVWKASVDTKIMVIMSKVESILNHS